MAGLRTEETEEATVGRPWRQELMPDDLEGNNCSLSVDISVVLSVQLPPFTAPLVFLLLHTCLPFMGSSERLMGPPCPFIYPESSPLVCASAHVGRAPGGCDRCNFAVNVWVFIYGRGSTWSDRKSADFPANLLGKNPQSIGSVS